MADERDPKNDLASYIIDSEKHCLALEWLAKIGRWRREWGVVKGGGQANPDVVKEIPQTEFHEIASFGALVRTKIDLIAAFNRAREAAETQGEPGKMDVYVNLVLADEVLGRLEDGRLVLEDFSSKEGPVLVLPDSLLKPTRKKENPEE